MCTSQQTQCTLSSFLSAHNGKIVSAPKCWFASDGTEFWFSAAFLLERCVRIHSRIEIHLEKTQVWNRGGFELSGCHLLIELFDMWTPQQWCGDAITQPRTSKEVKVLGTPLGHRVFVKAQLRVITALGQDSSGHGSTNAWCRRRGRVRL